MVAGSRRDDVPVALVDEGVPRALRLHLDVPLVDGAASLSPHLAHADLPAVPWTYAVVPRRPAVS
ncbi:hypothetical protein [Pseudokineococcus marinus]|uniref:Uncharacterized protein n=1 Tax=Pseudokineococcus marinus TaxID=351215 RepID=A0A849BG79_9ACTN|nr:hypothetical protein [Pseudokineococcus marinus]NNH22090.1 hypothetical protein [Pseudokineococcus marinus]